MAPAQIIFSSLLVISVMAYQGIHVLRTGQIDLFFVQPTQKHVLSSVTRRLGYAFVYLLPSVIFGFVLTTALEESGTSRLSNWLVNNYILVFFSLSFTVLGWLNLVRPAEMLRWQLRDMPEVADRPSALLIARFIGVGFIAMGIAILAGS